MKLLWSFSIPFKKLKFQQFVKDKNLFKTLDTFLTSGPLSLFKNEYSMHIQNHKQN